MGEAVVAGFLKIAGWFLLWLVLVIAATVWAALSSAKSGLRIFVMLLAVISVPGYFWADRAFYRYEQEQAPARALRDDVAASAIYKTLCEVATTNNPLVNSVVNQRTPVDIVLLRAHGALDVGLSSSGHCWLDSQSSECPQSNIAGIQWTQIAVKHGCKSGDNSPECKGQFSRWNRQLRSVESIDAITASYSLTVVPLGQHGGRITRHIFRLENLKNSAVLAEGWVVEKAQQQMVDGRLEPRFCPDPDMLLSRMMNAVFPLPNK